MAQKVTIRIGDHIIVKDGSHENMFIKEGNVIQFTDIGGTENKRIHLDTPFIIDVEK